MAKLKELRESAPKWMTTSLFDILVTLDPTETNKFVPMMMKVLEKEHTTQINQSWNERQKEQFINEFSGTLSPPLIDTSDFLVTYTNFKLLSETFLFQNSTIQDINEFIDLFMKKYITNVDVQQIKTWEEITNIVSIANVKFNTKEFEKQIVNVFEDDRWLIVRPLTYESSLKYGTSTRWCTASKQYPEHFFRYSESGMLFYCINKISGYKVALYKSVREQDLSFWNSADMRIDSMESELDGYIYDIIKKEITNPEQVSNCDLDVLVYNESFERNIKRKKSQPHDERPVGREMTTLDNVVNELTQDIDREVMREMLQEIDREVGGELMSEIPNTLNPNLEEGMVEMVIKPHKLSRGYDAMEVSELYQPQEYENDAMNEGPMMAG